MAWPSTALTSYLPGTTPWIKADDLNAFQSAINRIINGTYTLKTLYVDSTGGNTAAQLPGLVVANGLVTHTTLPNTVNYAAGTVAQGTVARAWAVVNADGSFAGRGYKVYSTGRTPAGLPSGDYTVVFDTNPSDRVHAAVFANIVDLVVGGASIQAQPFDSGGRQGVRVFTGTPSLTDQRFSVGIFAE